MLWFLCNLADEKEESLPSVSKPFVSCNSLLSSLLERRRDAFIVHLAPNHRLLYELAVNPPVSSTQMHQGHGRSLGPVPSTHLQKPPWEDASPSHPAKARKTARQASGERPIWIASAIADGPSIGVAWSRKVPKPASWFHDGTRAPTSAAESA